MAEERIKEKEEAAPAAAPRAPAAPMFSGAGVAVMLVVMVIEAAVVFWIVRWWGSAGGGDGVSDALEQDVVTVDLGMIGSSFASERGVRTYNVQVVLRINPELDDPADAAAKLEKHKVRLVSLIQRHLKSKGDALQDPGAADKLESEIRGLVNETFPAEDKGAELVSEVYLTEKS